MDSSQSARAKLLPWATVVITATAIITFCFARLSAVFIFDRSLISNGQVWRIWTGHIVHFTPGHLGWDLAVFLPAGCWLERLKPGCARWFYLLGPILISAFLFIFDPTLERYAGLSGLATGVLVLLAVLQLQRPNESPWLWWGVLLLVAAKLIIEFRHDAPLIVSDFVNVRNVPLAHLSGTGCGLVWGLVCGRTKRAG